MSEEKRDPLINPQPGDAIKQDGLVLEVLKRQYPGVIYRIKGTKLMMGCSVTDWQEERKEAKVVSIATTEPTA